MGNPGIIIVNKILFLFVLDWKMTKHDETIRNDNQNALK